ncbi:conserved hypothetical protein [Alteromonas sp. 38]|uniref:arginine decarboxylase n=1 Tax=Alteromonas TaxID=226 RepID=UPI0012F106F9|nr:MULTISPECIES: arginine decarboxylase [Alteromonas]CAD5248273.1 conserved hypothetical protein [Alteromonas sp. 154]VXC51553.1 conserved hypothetical protein [Alteromonas sp. 38]
MSNQYYHIEVFQDLILVTLRGRWDMSTNIQYLATFADTLNARRGKAFHIIVDMRSWEVPDSEFFARMKAPIQIDRRNQKIEIWLEDDKTVADHIAAKFFNEQNFTLHRTKNQDSFIRQVDSVFSGETKAYILEWVSRQVIDKQN